MLDKARETAGELVEKAQPMVDKAVEAGGDLLEKAKGLLTREPRAEAGRTGTGAGDSAAGK